MSVGDNIIVKGVLDTKDNVLTPLEIENLTTGEKTGKKVYLLGALFFIFGGICMMYYSGFRISLLDLIITPLIIVTAIWWSKHWIKPRLGLK